MRVTLLTAATASLISACSTVPERACQLPEALTRPAPPLAAPDALMAPLPLTDVYTLWLDDVRRYNALRARHNALAEQVSRCARDKS